MNAKFPFERLLSGSGRTLIHVVLLGIGAIYIFPFVWMLGTSFKTPGEFFSLGLRPIPKGEWQWSNFTEAWVTANFGQYFLNTALLAVSVTALVVVLTAMAAYALSRLNVPFKPVILGAVFLTFFLPSGIFNIIPIYDIVQNLGLLNSLGAPILVLTGGQMVFNTLLFYGYMRTMPHEIEEAAVIDGASVHQRFRYVVLADGGADGGDGGAFHLYQHLERLFRAARVYALSSRATHPGRGHVRLCGRRQPTVDAAVCGRDHQHFAHHLRVYLVARQVYRSVCGGGEDVGVRSRLLVAAKPQTAYEQGRVRLRERGRR